MDMDNSRLSFDALWIQAQQHWPSCLELTSIYPDEAIEADLIAEVLALRTTDSAAIEVEVNSIFFKWLDLSLAELIRDAAYCVRRISLEDIRVSLLRQKFERRLLDDYQGKFNRQLDEQSRQLIHDYFQINSPYQELLDNPSQATTQTNDLKVDVSLYLHGRKLDPNIITQQLRLKPSEAYKNIAEGLPADAHMDMRKLGMWCLRVSVPVRKMSDGLSQFAHQLMKARKSLLKLPGVELAYVDVFMCKSFDINDPKGNTWNFKMEMECLAALQRLNIPVEFTVVSINDQ